MARRPTLELHEFAQKIVFLLREQGERVIRRLARQRRQQVDHQNLDQVMLRGVALAGIVNPLKNSAEPSISCLQTLLFVVVLTEESYHISIYIKLLYVAVESLSLIKALGRYSGMTYLCGRIDGGASGHMGTHIPGDGSKGVVAQAFKLIYLVGLLSAGLIEIPNPAKALEIPQVISFSGIVNDSKGEPLQTGPYTFSFRIYDHPTHPPCKQNDQSDCARLIWGPQVFDGETSMGHFDKVEVYDGSYNILLGPYDISGMPIAQAFATSDRYVEVTIEDDEPSNPRIQFY